MEEVVTVEPEWWLRMMCGQLAEEEPFRAKPGTLHLGWFALLSRRTGRRVP
jgi:hypothetical protein